jgi:ESF2/ABP1 family protein
MDPAEPELFEFNDDGTEKAPGASSSKKVLSEKALAKARKDQAKRGVIYLGSIPPFMKPQKLRQLLTPYGNLDRMYLMPEDPEMRARRKKFKVRLFYYFHVYGQLN